MTEFIIAFVFGFFATNSLPHIIPGVHGKPFYSPFASPPAKGKSSAVVNVLWGFFNIVVAYILFVATGINLRDYTQGVGFLLGILITSLILAITFGANNKREE
ncbi:MAG: hypothetical protein SNF69_07535 [Rikenellaceae bacterium]